MSSNSSLPLSSLLGTLSCNFTPHIHLTILNSALCPYLADNDRIFRGFCWSKVFCLIALLTLLDWGEHFRFSSLVLPTPSPYYTDVTCKWHRPDQLWSGVRSVCYYFL